MATLRIRGKRETRVKDEHTDFLKGHVNLLKNHFGELVCLSGRAVEKIMSLLLCYLNSFLFGFQLSWKFNVIC